MEYNLVDIVENKNKITYLVYDNGKTIEIARNNNHKILNNRQHIFIFYNNELFKVYDVYNKRFVNKAMDMKLIYNKFCEDRKREYYKKKILKNN